MIILALIITSCGATRSAKGTAIGAGAGGVIGGVIGAKKDNTAIGAIIGATVGGTAGALIGRYMDKQARELEDELDGAEVERVGEGILVTFDSGLLFDFDSYALRAETKANLREMATTLDKYEDTNLLIEGHTDAQGSSEYNQELSRNRAQSVSSYLAQQGVSRSRLIIEGYGEQQPVASNETADGRQKNRRVEVAIYANDALKQRAEEGDLQ